MKSRTEQIKRKRKPEDTPPRIYKVRGSISMEFPNGYIQSEMLLDDPNHLVLSYTRAMLAFRFFRPEPGRIAMIGLGGGSMVKWCYHNLPATEIIVIEINPHVIALREQFQIPEDDERLRVAQGDGADYIATTKDAPDVLVVDGFDVAGQPAQLCTPQFYRHCYRALSRDGIMVVNLCGPDDRKALNNMRDAFRGRMIIATPIDCENQIAFAFKGRRSEGEKMDAEELSDKLRDYVHLPVRVEF